MRAAIAVAVVVVLVWVAGACGSRDDVSQAAPAPAPTPAPAAAVPAAPADAAVAAAATAPSPGYDFIADVEVLYRVVACGHQDRPLPELITHGDADRAAALQRIVDKHCAELEPHMAKYRADYFDKARAWFVAHEPSDLPTTVVYGFGGGDLVSALVAFPAATQITTVSLELAGDPRKVEALAPDQLEHDLAGFRKDIGMLIWVGSNLSTNLSDAQRSAIAAQLSSHLLGMSTGNYEPIAARFFAIEDDGGVHYYTKDEIDADTKTGRSLSGAWHAPAFAQSFQNVEIQYRAIGETTVRTFRHVAWNLVDDYLKKHPGVLRFLDKQGKVAICVKGASYLLWLDDFAMFRRYIIDHLAWMVADSTGLAPNYAAPAGLVQRAYGRFVGPVKELEKMAGLQGDVASQAMWAKPVDKMPFRFGYLDKEGHSHVVITTPKPN